MGKKVKCSCGIMLQTKKPVSKAGSKPKRPIQSAVTTGLKEEKVNQAWSAKQKEAKKQFAKLTATTAAKTEELSKEDKKIQKWLLDKAKSDRKHEYEVDFVTRLVLWFTFILSVLCFYVYYLDLKEYMAWNQANPNGDPDDAPRGGGSLFGGLLCLGVWFFVWRLNRPNYFDRKFEKEWESEED